MRWEVVIYGGCNNSCDRALQKCSGSVGDILDDGIKLAVFDMDGVLVDATSSWVLVHQHFGTHNEDSLRAFMAGEIDDSEFIRRDVERWRMAGGEVSVDEVQRVLDKAPIFMGAVETLLALWEAGVVTAIVTGGLLYLAERIRSLGHVKYVYANDVEVDEQGLLTGEGRADVPLKDKAAVMRTIMDAEAVTKAQTASLGNSLVDIPMFRLSGLSIAFNPLDELTASSADHVVRSEDLRVVLPLLLGGDHSRFVL